MADGRHEYGRSPVSQSLNQHDHEKKRDMHTCMGTAVSDTLIRYGGVLGVAWPSAPRAVEPNRWELGASLADKLN